MKVPLRLYTVSHKPFFLPGHDYLQRVWVGGNRQLRKGNDLTDDTGENISSLNEFFCELTVMYWVWKNVPMPDDACWGLCHYRRFFTDKSRPLSFSNFPMNRAANEKEMSRYVHATLDDFILTKLQQSDIVLTYPVNVSLRRKVNITVYDQYTGEHSKEEWDMLRTVIAEKYPDYIPSLRLLAAQTKICIANMMVARAAVWNHYLPWLFDITFELHKRLKYTDDVYQRRAVAFIAERLMNLYIHHNKLKPAYMQLVVFDK